MSLPAIVLVGFLASAQGAEKPTVRDLQVSIQSRQVEISFQLEGGLTDELFERIQTGLPSGFTFDFVLFRDHKRWFDSKLDSASLQVVAMYNAVTREYIVNFKQDGRLVDSRVARDRDDLERIMTRFEGVHVFTLGDLNPKRRLLIRARADLGSKTLLGLIPTKVATEWVRSRKFRPDEE